MQLTGFKRITSDLKVLETSDLWSKQKITGSPRIFSKPSFIIHRL